MPRCIDNCPDADLSTYYTVWADIRENFGPKPDAMMDSYRLDLYSEDYGNYILWFDAWNAEHGAVVGGQDLVDSTTLFKKWLNWRCRVGTPSYANLPQRLRDHVGISCIPCPYDTKSSSVRANAMLGFFPAQTDHGIYYMKVSLRGTSWGFECTYDSCPYYISNGQRYFYS